MQTKRLSAKADIIDRLNLAIKKQVNKGRTRDWVLEEIIKGVNKMK